MDLRAGQGRRADTRQGGSRSHPGDRRDHRPRLQVGTARLHSPGGPALLFENVKGHPGVEAADQPVRLRVPHAHGAGRRRTRRSRRPHPHVHGREVAAGPARQNQDAAHAGRDGQVLSQGSFDRPVQGSHPARQFFAARFSDSAMLAARWRPLHHLAVGHHERSQDRQAQRRHVSHAGLRRAHHRHALAAPEARRRTLSRAHAASRGRRRSESRQLPAST